MRTTGVIFMLRYAHATLLRILFIQKHIWQLHFIQENHCALSQRCPAMMTTQNGRPRSCQSNMTGAYHSGRHSRQSSRELILLFFIDKGRHDRHECKTLTAADEYERTIRTSFRYSGFHPVHRWKRGEVKSRQHWWRDVGKDSFWHFCFVMNRAVNGFNDDSQHAKINKISNDLQNTFASLAFYSSKCDHWQGCSCHGWDCQQFQVRGPLHAAKKLGSITGEGTPIEEVCWKGAYHEVCGRCKQQGGFMIQAQEESHLGEGQKQDIMMAYMLKLQIIRFNSSRHSDGAPGAGSDSKVMCFLMVPDLVEFEKRNLDSRRSTLANCPLANWWWQIPSNWRISKTNSDIRCR